jgi:hypothetical protein
MRLMGAGIEDMELGDAEATASGLESMLRAGLVLAGTIGLPTMALIYSESAKGSALEVIYMGTPREEATERTLLRTCFELCVRGWGMVAT